MLLHHTMFSTYYSALDETAAITDGAEEIYSLSESTSSCRLTANLVKKRHYSVNES